MELEDGVQRWVVDISKWRPSPHDFTSAVALLPRHEHPSINRFFKWEDRKRALISQMLQYALVHRVLSLPFEDIVIRRTHEGKPFLVCDHRKLGFPNFNFNVSHQGDYVAIASEPICLVGLDIVSYSLPVNEEAAGSFLQSFSSYFSQSEWRNVLNAGSSDEMMKTFYRYWSLKEAFVKAIGTGVGYKLDSIEFHHTCWENISARVAGEELSDWKFWLLELDQHHAMAIARGNPKLANPNFLRTLKQAEFDDKEYNAGLNLPNGSLNFLSVEDLLERMPRPVNSNVDAQTI